MTETPEWLTQGARVVHDTFGTGVVAHVGKDRGVAAIWIDFDAGMRTELAPEYALPHLRPQTSDDAVTPPHPAERCDYCGSRPVIMTVSGSDGTRRCCADHRRELARDL